MRLESIRIENYRGIRTASLTFDDITMLVGENDSGKTSIIEALAGALAPDGGEPGFAPHLFHRRGGSPDASPEGPIVIELSFAGMETLGEPLRSRLGERRSRGVMLRIHANPGADNEIVAADWEIGCSDGGRPIRNDIEALAALRAAIPVFWIRGGLLVAASEAGGAQAVDSGANGARTARLADEIESHYRQIVSGSSRSVAREIEAGFDAARQLLASGTIRLRAAGPWSRQVGGDLVATAGFVSGPGRADWFPSRGSGAQQMGVLLLTAALIRSGAVTPAEEASPIIVIDDPEAHLHPMTLAAVSRLLAEIPWQKIIATQSDEVLSLAPLHCIRRITRSGGEVREWKVDEKRLTPDERRRFAYHVRLRRGDAGFARCWLLVEGETEFWVFPELARRCGYDFALEGIECVEFAQCGLPPIVKVAKDLGIEWHVVTDGDRAGTVYAETAQRFIAKGEPQRLRITRIPEPDVEHCFWSHGYRDVYLKAAGFAPNADAEAGRVIDHAVSRYSKPYLAFELIEALRTDQDRGVPAPIRDAIERCVELARSGAGASIAKGAGKRRGRRRP